MIQVAFISQNDDNRILVGVFPQIIQPPFQTFKTIMIGYVKN